jgi:hypothetical protein
MADFHDEEFGFRFTGLTPEMQKRLRVALPGFEIGSRDPQVALVVLRAAQDLQPLYAFLEREDIEPGSCSVWVSVVTSRDHDGLKLPQDIVDLIRLTKGGVEFSFVACLGAEEDASTDEGSTPVGNAKPQ